jgi:hypothetical protein
MRQGRAFLERLEAAVDASQGAWLPLAVFATGDYGRWLTGNNQNFTSHGYLDFAIGCDVLRHTSSRSLIRDLPFVRLQVRRFASTMAMSAKATTGLALLYARHEY